VNPALAALVILVIAYFAVFGIVGQAWLDGRASGRQTGLIAGSVLTLVIGIPVLLQVAQRGDSLGPALAMVAFLAVVLIPLQVGLMDYAEQHGVREEIRRLRERRRRKD
jgi:hypothetical protein